MKERPILFSGPMVRAILEGHKTQTRRVAKEIPEKYGHVQPLSNGNWEWSPDGGFDQWIRPLVCTYGVPGDRLWVRETWTGTFHLDSFHVAYAADGSEAFVEAPVGYILPIAALKPANWVTPLFMPRWASRIALEVTDVRVQRLQEISEEDAVCEGTPYDGGTNRHAFERLWDSINAKRGFGWDVNPWVWALTFKQL